MLQVNPSQIVNFLNRLYTRLFILCPPDFRRTYAQEITQLFRDCGRNIYQQQGLGAYLIYWLRAVGDLGWTALQEQWAAFVAGHLHRQRGKQMASVLSVDRQFFGEQVVALLAAKPGYYSLLTIPQPLRAVSEMTQYLALDVDLGQPERDLHLFKELSSAPPVQRAGWLTKLCEGIRRTYAAQSIRPGAPLEQFLHTIYSDAELFHLLAEDEAGTNLVDLVDCLALDGDSGDLNRMFQLLQELSTPITTLGYENEEAIIAANQHPANVNAQPTANRPVRPGVGEQPSLHWQYQQLADTFCMLAEDCLSEARYAEGLALLNSPSLHWLEQTTPSRALIRLQLQRARLLWWQAYPNADQAGYEQALAILHNAEPTARFLGDQHLLAQLFHWLGVLHYSQEWGTTALTTPLHYFEAALALRRTLDDQAGIVESSLGIGWVYQHKVGANADDARRAMEVFQAAYQLAHTGNVLREKATAARHIGVMHWWRGEHEQALQRALEFLTLQENLGFQPELPPAYFSLGFAYLNLDDLDNAQHYFEQLRTLAEAKNYQRYLAEAAIGLGLVSERRNQVNEALIHYRRALHVAAAIGFQRVVVAATKLLAQLDSTIVKRDE